MSKQDEIKAKVRDSVEDNTIDLSLSELTEVPVKIIETYKKVTIIDLSNNNLISLGNNFTRLSHLTKLDLSKNQIKFLPKDFGVLRNLRHLDLYNNRLEYLPLSFGNLTNLRYLDLKGNPLPPALLNVVGPCLTTRECNESAKKTVKFLAQMQIQFEEEMKKIKEEKENASKLEEIENAAKKNNDIQKSKTKNKTKKNKAKKLKTDLLQNKINNTNNNQKQINSTNSLNDLNDYENQNQSNSVFKTIVVFVGLLLLNILLFYVITVKNPEIADKLVEMIPENYRDIILTKSENMKLNFLKISDWVKEFRTTPPS